METTSTVHRLNFANRIEELKIIKETINRLTTPGKLLPRQILEFNGIGGIGKTALLMEFVKKCKNIENLCYSFIDISNFRRDRQIKKNSLIAEIVRQLDLKNELHNHILDLSNKENNSQDLTKQFIKYLNYHTQPTRPGPSIILFFDSVDEVDQEAKNWLISIVEQFVNINKILFVFASKISLEFENNPLLDKRVYSLFLKEFDEEEYSLNQIKGLSYFKEGEELKNWAKLIHKVTNGHPLANEIVALEAIKRQCHPQVFLDKQYEFIKSIDRQVVTEKIFHGYDEEEIKRFREMLTPLSIPRMFNLVSMGKLIGQFAPSYSMKSSWHYSNYIRALQKETSFIRYSKEKSAYIVDPILRNVFSFTLKNNHPLKFKKINEFMFNTYSEWIVNTKGTDKTKYFLEKVYHMINLKYSVNKLLKEFTEFAHDIGKKMDQENQQNVKQQFVEEFERDPDLNDFFDDSTKNRIITMLLGN